MRVVAVGLLVAVVGTGFGRSQAVAARRSTGTVSLARSIVLYSVPTQLQYDNFADDRARGLGHNPFGNYAAPYTVRPANNELAFGPSAGDESFIAYTLYRDSALTRAVGSAVFVCVYGLAKNASCNASFQVGEGSITGIGTFPFYATRFTLALTGGTAGYRGVKGLLVATPSAAARAHATPLLAQSPNLMGQAQRLVFSVTPPTPGTGPVGVTAFSFPVKEQYLDHNDDEARGDADNPFGPRVYKQCLSLTHPLEVSCSARLSHMASVAIDEHSDGPYPGDQSVFTFDVYSSPKRTTRAGGAVLTCQYYFDKNGFCDETIQLEKGTLFAVGPFSFDAKSFTLAVTGGSGGFAGLSGDVRQSPGGNHTQRLTVTLLG